MLRGKARISGASPRNTASLNIPIFRTSSRNRRKLGCGVQLDDMTYYVGHEYIVHREQGATLPVWQEGLFAAMVRNAAHVTDYFRLPSRQVVEIGRQVSI